MNTRLTEQEVVRIMRDPEWAAEVIAVMAALAVAGGMEREAFCAIAGEAFDGAQEAAREEPN